MGVAWTQINKEENEKSTWDEDRKNRNILEHLPEAFPAAGSMLYPSCRIMAKFNATCQDVYDSFAKA